MVSAANVAQDSVPIFRIASDFVHSMKPPSTISGFGSSPTTVVEWSDVHKTYRMGDEKVHALNGVDWTIRQGEYWAVMGPSGSGKSTLLNLLGCLDRPSRGRCRMFGHELRELSDDQLSELRLRRLGFIFQSFNLIPQLTVCENIELPLFYMGETARAAGERARALAVEVGLADRLQHRPTELSGGQQQRVAVARALAADPWLLLADEPTGNLDTATSAQIMELLDGLHAQGRTVVLVTHEDQIASHAKSALHMLDGRIDKLIV